MNTENYSLATVSDDDANFIVDLTTRTTSYCSMTAATPEEQATLYNAMNNPDKRIKDCINEVIEIKDVFVEAVTCHNEKTGEISQCPRTVLIDTNGTAYQAVSLGIFSALKKMFSVFGEPATWAQPVKVKIRLISRSADKNILTFDVVA